MKTNNIFKNLLIALVLTFGIALNVSAQKDNRPPKNPPTIPVQPKNPPPPNPPRDDNRPKKPETFVAGINGEVTIS